MKTLYLDCGMGAAGDMLTGALYELQEDPAAALEELNAMGLPGVLYEAERAVRCGITGTHMKVLVNGQEEEAGAPGGDHEHGHGHDHGDHHDHEHGHEHGHDHGGHHHHYSLKDIMDIAEALPVSTHVRAGIEEVYRRIADAESRVHGMPVEEVHFHEVGAMDAVADVAGALWLFDRLGPVHTIVSPVRTGFGEVKCAHGILPVPAPATALLLEGIPVYAGDLRGEMCTPTGAALIGYLADEYGTFPEMTIKRTGYGMGKKEFPRANCVRAMLGEAGVSEQASEETDEVFELICNLDDMTGEDLAAAQKALLEEGALDVWTVPVFMKKGRPGTELHVLTDAERRGGLIRTIFRTTTTIGIRESAMCRYVLRRHAETEETVYGPVRKKVSEGYGVCREKYEYDDLARISENTGEAVHEIRSRLKKHDGGSCRR